MKRKLSKTDLCIIRDAAKPGGVKLAPRAKAHLERLSRAGLIRYRKLSNGWYMVKGALID